MGMSQSGEALRWRGGGQASGPPCDSPVAEGTPSRRKGCSR